MKRNIIITILSCFLFAACNKESLLEGFIPEYQEVIIDKKIPVQNGSSGSHQLISSMANGQTLGIYMSSVRIKAASAAGYDAGTVGVNDSVIIISISTDAASGFRTAHNGYSLVNFSYGDNLTHAAPAGRSLVLATAYKKPPYTTSYASITHTIYGNVNFKINDEGYLSFYKTSASSTAAGIYGWIKIKITPDHVYFEKAGYKTFENIKAGQSK